MNESRDLLELERMGSGAHSAPDEIELVEITSPVDSLLESVRLAASELEQQGEKSNRIATQLLTALSKFARETGRP
jgi:hypothetical protein